jgi:hypothetical protein
MSEFRFLCPECGHAFPEGTSFTHCPKCRVALREASPSRTADLHKLPDHLDLDALMRQVLAEQLPDEEVDVAVERVVRQNFPDAREGLFRLISQQLDAYQQMQGKSRQEAAEQLGKAESELQLGPEGTPVVHTRFLPEVHFKGLEKLPPEQREQVQQQIEAAMKAGKPLDTVRIVLPAAKGKVGCGSMVLAGAAVALLAWAMHV